MTLSLQDLGWSVFFDQQIHDDDAGLTPMRIAGVHRDRLAAFAPHGDHSLTTPPDQPTGDFAVGDWVLADAQNRVARTLDRQTLLSRRAAGTEARVQLIAANVDTLFITSSCNADFNPARIERYLALAQESGCFAVLLLTRADLTNDAADYARTAQSLSPALPVLTINALNPDDLARVADWCRPGQTAALVGSSGVGKSTVMNGLTGETILTRSIRQDARGRHTTTARALRRMANGGWLIDTPGMRALRLHDTATGIDELFAEIAALQGGCRFADCSHDTEPGCAIQAAISDDRLDPERLQRWHKLRREDVRNSESLADSRARNKGLGKLIRTTQRAKMRRDS